MRYRITILNTHERKKTAFMKITMYAIMKMLLPAIGPKGSLREYDNAISFDFNTGEK